MNARHHLSTHASHTLVTHSPAALVGIFEPDVQLAIWQRPADPLIASYLEASRHGLGRGLRTTLEAGQCPEVG